MSYTNKTQHYELPQWVGTDKPTWLGDMNSAFATIDSKIYSATSMANSASSSAQTANNAISALTSTVNQNSSDILDLESLFDFTLTRVPIPGTSSALSVAMNPDKSLFKIYGGFILNNTDLISDGKCVIPLPTGLFTKSMGVSYSTFMYVIENSVFKNFDYSSFQITPEALRINLITYATNPSPTSQVLIRLLPMLLVYSDFGD